MKKITPLLLLIIEVLLLFKLSINQDRLLFLVIVFVQLLICMAALNFNSRERKSENFSIKKQGALAILAILVVTPILLFHKSHFEPSSWSEAGLLIQGPYSTVLVLFGVFGAVIATLTSLYLRGEK